MNKILFLHNSKTLIKPFIAFLCLLSLYSGVIIWMFDPKMAETLSSLSKNMPQFFSMMNMAVDISSLTAFLTNYLYGFLMIIIPLIFIIIASQRVVVHHTESGSLAGLLAAPISRRTFIVTQGATLIISILLLITFCTVIGILFAQTMFPGDLDFKGFIRVNVGLFTLQFAVGGLCFFASSIFNETKTSLMVAAGIPLIAYLIQMISNVSSKLADAKYFTFYTLFDSQNTLAGEGTLNMIILFVSGLVLYLMAGIIFCRRDLHI